MSAIDLGLSAVDVDVHLNRRGQSGVVVKRVYVGEDCVEPGKVVADGVAPATLELGLSTSKRRRSTSEAPSSRRIRR